MKRFKHATAHADGYHVVCPYKACGHMNSLNVAKKGMIEHCHNCRKTYRITKVD